MSARHIPQLLFALHTIYHRPVTLEQVNIVPAQVLAIPDDYELATQARYEFTDPPSCIHGAPSVVYCDEDIYLASCTNDPHECLCYFWSASALRRPTRSSHLIRAGNRKTRLFGDDMKTITQILNEAADLIEQRGWTQGVYARDIYGNMTEPTSPEAVCFCTSGAIRCAVGVQLADNRNALEAFNRAKNALLAEVRYGGLRYGVIPEWNDTEGRTKGEVVNALRLAALRAAAG